MPIAINGTGTITGISAGGLPDDCITTADIAAGAVTQAKRSEQLTLATAQNTTSGTSIDFTGIPSWVKRITVMFNGVSTNGTGDKIIQVGSGSITSTGYTSYAINHTGTAGSGVSSTAGFIIRSNAATDTISGHLFINLVAGNTWVSSHSGKCNSTTWIGGGGDVALSGTLDRIRITTVNGTDTFDAGSINIMYE